MCVCIQFDTTNRMNSYSYTIVTIAVVWYFVLCYFLNYGYLFQQTLICNQSIDLSATMISKRRRLLMTSAGFSGCDGLRCRLAG